MGKTRRLTNAFIALLLLLFLVTLLPIHTQAANTLNINLKNNQTFYLLPGTDRLDYKVTVSGNASGDMTCSSSNLTVADIDNMGNLSINDAGSTKSRYLSVVTQFPARSVFYAGVTGRKHLPSKITQRFR